MTPELQRQVDELLAAAGSGRRPPLHLWHPPLSGDIDIRIARDGRWYHEGTLMARERLVQLFASILRREGDGHFLVTPVEKWRIRVDDTPFVAVDVEVLGAGQEQQLVFTTNVGERVLCGAAQPLRAGADAEGPVLQLRDGLEARLARPPYYRLAELAELRPDGMLSVRSGGAWFPLGPAC